MPTYKYTATDPYGSRVSGTYDASSEKEVQIYLRRSELTPESIKRSWIHADIQFGGNRLGHKDLIVFTRMFSAMAKAAVPMDQALDILFEQTEVKALKRAVQRMIVEVESGSSLSEAMSSQSSIFDGLYVNMIAAGEQSGNLDLMLDRLSELLEKTASIKAKVKGAMVYPAILAVIAIGVVALMMLFVIPQFVSLFRSSGVPLPFLTEMMLGISEFLTGSWWMLLLGAGGGFALFRWLRRQEKVARAMDRLLIRMPILGSIAQKGAIARFTRTLSTLINSGVGILDGLELT
ncbi:MAG TPA: type II secretion system F family protein, partial [Chromatiales bacterium]|nr:type II secretion system F family protein [Chromatiales bacterium]